MQQAGKYLIISGIILIVIGIIIYFSGFRNNWIGHLPGDIRIEKENYKFYFPITTSLLISLLITVIVWIIRKLIH